MENWENNVDKLMEELQQINETFPMDEIILVVDSMTGQDVINVINVFHDALPLTVAILTKLDGTAKGGVVIGIVEENKMPIKFIGVGEQIEDMEPFNAEEFVKAFLE